MSEEIEVFCEPRFALFQQSDPLNRIPDLSDIPLPLVVEQHLLSLRRDLAHAVGRRPGEFVQEPLYQGNDVFASLAERGEVDVRDVEAVIQILPEIAGVGGLLEIQVCRGDDADVDADVLFTTQAVEGPLLEHVEELDLVVLTELADFVQEQRAVVRGFELADP